MGIESRERKGVRVGIKLELERERERENKEGMKVGIESCERGDRGCEIWKSDVREREQ